MKTKKACRKSMTEKKEVLIVQTVRQNYKSCAKKQVYKAVMDRNSLGMLFHPSAQDLEYLVSINNIDDCPITIHHVKNAHAIFGPDIAGARGKPVRHKPEHFTIY